MSWYRRIKSEFTNTDVNPTPTAPETDRQLDQSLQPDTELSQKSVPEKPTEQIEPEIPEKTEPKQKSTNSISQFADPKFWKKLGVNAKYAEIVSKHWVGDKCDTAIAKLPPKQQQIVKGVLFAGKMATKGLFISYTQSQKAVRRLAMQQGLSAAQARKLRGVCSAVDLISAHPVSVAVGVALGPWWGLALSMIPVGSASYLAYSQAKNSLAIAKRASSAIALAMKSKPKAKSPVKAAKIQSAAEKVHRAMLTHNYDEWYYALFLHAVDKTSNVDEAIKTANTAYTLSKVVSKPVKSNEIVRSRL